MIKKPIPKCSNTADMVTDIGEVSLIFLFNSRIDDKGNLTAHYERSGKVVRLFGIPRRILLYNPVFSRNIRRRFQKISPTGIQINPTQRQVPDGFICSANWENIHIKPIYLLLRLLVTGLSCQQLRRYTVPRGRCSHDTP